MFFFIDIKIHIYSENENLKNNNNIIFLLILKYVKKVKEKCILGPREHFDLDNDFNFESHIPVFIVLPD